MNSSISCRWSISSESGAESAVRMLASQFCWFIELNADFYRG